MTPNRLQRGFTLIEMMIALLIFSIGLMGMAGLMVLSVKTNQSAYLRTQASFLAQSMADRMRSNLGLINSYNGTYDYSTAAADPCASGAACSPAQMVTRDRAVWSRQMVDTGELLPPALPVGTLFARLRALHSDGSLGATGAVSRLTTLLPAPKTEQAQPTLVQGRSGYELRWSLPVDVPGYELRLSSNDQFPDEQTHVIRTKSLWRKVAPQSDGAFYWTIQAINEFGQPMSARSSVQTVAPRPALKPLALKTPTTPRAPANIPRPQLEPMLPAEDAIVVGGATARRYGALKWEGSSSRFPFHAGLSPRSPVPHGQNDSTRGARPPPRRGLAARRAQSRTTGVGHKHCIRVASHDKV